MSIEAILGLMLGALSSNLGKIVAGSLVTKVWSWPRVLFSWVATVLNRRTEINTASTCLASVSSRIEGLSEYEKSVLFEFWSGEESYNSGKDTGRAIDPRVEICVKKFCSWGILERRRISPPEVLRDSEICEIKLTDDAVEYLANCPEFS